MKFLPSLRPAILVAVGVALSACHSVTDTPANRRELYNSSYNNSGSWHDYTRRREAEAMTGTSGGSAPSTLPGARPAGGPPAVAPGAPGALPPGAVEPAPVSQSPLSPAGPSTVPPPAEVAPTIPGADAGAPPAATDAAATPAPAQ